jgi:single-stranded-DNA-specific exonuclease
MTHANLAVELLLSDNLEKASKIAEEVNQNNSTRRGYDANITEEALEMIKGKDPSHKSNVLYKEDWHLGVLGIVASRCIEYFHRPTIVLTRSNGSATGSARSIPGFNIYEAILQCEDLLVKFGGHNYAAGLTLPLENLEVFKNRFEEIVSASIEEELLIPPLTISSKLDFESISMNFVSILEQMEPFGPGNSSPVFYAENLYLHNPARLIKEKHLKFRVRQEGIVKNFEAIGFGMSDYIDLIEEGQPFKMAFCVEKNSYMGNNSVQLRIKDILTE